MADLLMDEFKAIVGEMYYEQKSFDGQAGGAPNDSLRGFGATEQYWNVPTANGWTVRYGDNGAGIVSALSPSGEKWESGKRRSGAWVEEADSINPPGMRVAAHSRYESIMRKI